MLVGDIFGFVLASHVILL